MCQGEAGASRSGAVIVDTDPETERQTRGRHAVDLADGG